jgi:hypothetical protein
VRHEHQYREVLALMAEWMRSASAVDHAVLHTVVVLAREVERARGDGAPDE